MVSYFISSFPLFFIFLYHTAFLSCSFSLLLCHVILFIYSLLPQRPHSLSSFLLSYTVILSFLLLILFFLRSLSSLSIILSSFILLSPLLFLFPCYSAILSFFCYSSLIPPSFLNFVTPFTLFLPLSTSSPLTSSLHFVTTIAFSPPIPRSSLPPLRPH